MAGKPDPHQDPILTYGDTRLRQICRPVHWPAASLGELADRLWQTLLTGDGVGLAAPQVGDLRRVVICRDVRGSDGRRRLVLVNPEIVSCSADRSVFQEGCLSFPGLYLDLQRPRKIRIRFQDLEGRQQQLRADGLLARIIQHEVDHLDGVLFIDHLSLVRRWLLSWRLRRLSARSRRGIE